MIQVDDIVNETINDCHESLIKSKSDAPEAYKVISIAYKQLCNTAKSQAKCMNVINLNL